MTYVTKQDLLNRGWAQELVELTDKTNLPASVIDEVIVGAHIVDACSTIDGFLGTRYVLPLDVVPPALTKAAADLTRFYLHGDSATKDSPVERAYQAAMKWLRDVASGLVVLESAGVPPSPAGGGQVLVTDSERPMTVESMRGYI